MKKTMTLAVWIAMTLSAGTAIFGDAAADNRRERFSHTGTVDPEDPAATVGQRDRQASTPRNITEAPTGFDNLSNGYLDQGPDYESLNEDTVVPLRSYNDNRFLFEEVETNADGLGPTFNAQSCRECHQNVVTGGASQVTEHRTGRLNGDQFYESLGGSLIHSRATYPEIVERVAFEDDIRTFRISTSTLGDGFVEAIANGTLLAIRDRQPQAMRGTAVMTPVLEASGAVRIGRFGWKSQHASLESFSADAYLNEMGITSPLLPDENTSSGLDVSYGTDYDYVPDPEDDDGGHRRFRRFHALHQSAGPRPHHRGRADGRSAVHERGLRDLSRTDPSHDASRNGDQRRRFYRAGGARQQDDTPLQ